MHRPFHRPNDAVRSRGSAADRLGLLWQCLLHCGYVCIGLLFNQLGDSIVAPNLLIHRQLRILQALHAL